MAKLEIRDGKGRRLVKKKKKRKATDKRIS